MSLRICEPAVAAENGQRHYGKAPRGESIIYPGVNTCITITFVFGDGTLVGTHFGMLKASQDELAAISFSSIYSTLGLMGALFPANAQPTQALLLGNIGTWRASAAYGLTSFMNLNVMRTTVRGILGGHRNATEQDTNHVDGRQVDTVDIEVMPNGQFTITPR